MHSETFDIVKAESAKEMEKLMKQGYDIPLSNKEYDTLHPMNRAQRREWAKKNKKIPTKEGE